MTVLQDVRTALHAQIDGVIGFPVSAQRALEGKIFNPTIGTPWARLTLMTNSRRAFSLDGSDKVTGGLLQIDLFYPAKGGPGVGTIEPMADAVADAYPIDATLTSGRTRVDINYAQPGPILAEADWLHAVVTVSWTTLP